MPPPPPQAPKPKRPRPEVNLEDLLGGRVLAALGGVTILVGLAFFFALAVSRGWIGEGARLGLAGAGSVVFMGLGMWLHGRKGRTDAAVAALATGIAGGFLTLTVGAQVYDLLPAPVALLIAAGLGAFGAVQAVRWRNQLLGAIAMLGALLSPVLADAPAEGGTLAFVLIAALATAGLLVWQRWAWLLGGLFLVATPQWIAYIVDAPGVPATVATLVVFGLIGAVSAIGFDLRTEARRLGALASGFLALNALVLAITGAAALDDFSGETAVSVWLAALALAHLLTGVLAPRITKPRRVSHEIGLVILTIGVLLADVAWATIADGLGLVAGWSITGLGFALIVRRARAAGSAEGTLATIGLGGHLTLAMAMSLTGDSSPEAIEMGDPATLTGIAALLMVAASCFASARLAEEGRGSLRVALDIAGLFAVAYLTAYALEGAVLAAAWAAEAAALGVIARRESDEVAEWGALAFLACAALLAVFGEAPLESFIEGMPDVPAGALALGASAGACLLLAWLGTGGKQLTPWLAGSGGTLLLYLASVAIVSAYQPGAAQSTEVLDLGVREQGQLLVSLLWSVVGVAAVVAGLRGDLRWVRLVGLALLLGTVGKVFLYDLSTLTAGYRVISFMALGALLLAASFVWQRMRPRDPEDLREVPPTLRD
ncbi:MAG: DUF2339 domain-containing protein [Thermoleophilaceae bacterium]|nr:DUF2339 domain-containing protein [Thermoleophilaceae bacterium]